MLKLIDICTEYFELQAPMEFRIKTRTKKSCSAKYNAMLDCGNNLVSHRITVYLGNLSNDTRTFDELIAHEFIHAYQQENGIDEIHGGDFPHVAQELAKFLHNMGFNVHRIYIPEIDV